MVFEKTRYFLISFNCFRLIIYITENRINLIFFYKYFKGIEWFFMENGDSAAVLFKFVMNFKEFL
jgi:hypothetical protein